MAKVLVDTDLVAQVRSGDTGAYRLLVTRHQDVVFSFLLRRLQDRDLAEELTQDTFVRAYVSLAGYRGEACFRTWLIQIAVNLVRDRSRRERSRPVVVSINEIRRGADSGPPPLPDSRPGNDPVTRLDRREKFARLEQAVKRLPADYREVFLLKHVEGLSYEEIATMTGVSTGTLKVRAHRARRRLREWCNEEPKRGSRDGRHAGTLRGR